MSRFYFKIILPSIISILLFTLTIFLILIPRFQQNIMNGKREMIKELTNSAWSILSKYESDERNGIISREEAQKTAISRIQYLRYGEENKDYFWITDMTPTMIMHPYRTDLNGKDLRDFSDPHGKKLFVEFVNTVKESEHGYVDYMWQWKDDSLHIVPKLSYVEIFKPWGWVIGTGVYIEDVKKEIDELENKFILISVGISILIALLLLFIIQQSLKIERQKTDAEKELHESKEKYRTLVEAATEGLLMLIEGRISFTNNIICKMSGYEQYELNNLPFTELISKNNNTDLINMLSVQSIKEGQYEINLNKKGGGFLQSLVTVSTAKLYDKSVNIIIVKDLTTDKIPDLSILDYQKLISTLNAGFFKSMINNKSKFIFANETAIRIFGFENFNDLSETNISDMLINSDDMKFLKNDLIENGFVRNRILNIKRKKGEPAIVTITMVVVDKQTDDSLICDGILEDITTQENEKSEINKLITELKTDNFLIEQPVKDYISQLITLDSDSTINDAIQLLSRTKSDCLILTKNSDDFIGMVTNNDIQKRVLTLQLNLDNPVYLIMTSPVIYIKEYTTVMDAINICEEKNIHHLAVKNEDGKISGIIKINDIYKTLKDSLVFFNQNIQKIVAVEELHQYYKQLQLLIKPLIKSEINVKHITNITSSFSDAVTRRLFELALNNIGKPPVNFAFINMGSEGRKEETLFTDQDNAIIFDDVPKEQEESVREYFNKLGNRICNSLDKIGYSFCKGNIMAMNPKWCQSISTWEKYFSEWIITPEPQNLLDAIIFFDFRYIYGDDTLTDRLRKTISYLIKENPIFLYHLANNTYNTKNPGITAGLKSTETVNLKNAVNLIVMFARTYSLQNSIWTTNTIDRLNALNSKNIISKTSLDEIIYVYNFLMKLRFKNQINQSDNNQPLSNILDIKSIIDLELTVLKKALSLIPVYQNKIKTDFRLNI